MDLPSDAAYGGLPHGSLALAPAAAPGTWTFAFREADNSGASGTIVATTDGHRRLDPSAVRDIVVVVRYQVGA